MQQHYRKMLMPHACCTSSVSYLYAAAAMWLLQLGSARPDLIITIIPFSGDLEERLFICLTDGDEGDSEMEYVVLLCFHPH